MGVQRQPDPRLSPASLSLDPPPGGFAQTSLPAPAHQSLLVLPQAPLNRREHASGGARRDFGARGGGVCVSLAAPAELRATSDGGGDHEVRG